MRRLVARAVVGGEVAHLKEKKGRPWKVRKGEQKGRGGVRRWVRRRVARNVVGRRLKKA